MRRLLWITLAVVVFAAGCAKELSTPEGAGGGYERIVLAELFTATWCGNCPKAEEALDTLYDEEGATRLAVIHWHPTEGSDSPDPFGIVESDQRWDAYRARFDSLGTAGMPTCVFNGVGWEVGAPVVPYEEYQRHYANERAQGGHLSIALTPSIDEDILSVDITVTADEEGAFQDLVLTTVIVEHEVPRPDRPEETFSFVARSVACQSLTIAATGEVERNEGFTIDDDWNRDDLYVISFLQEVGLGEVHQAAMRSLRFREFSLTAPETSFVQESVPRSWLAEFTIENTGTLDDSLLLEVPEDLQTIPSLWTASVADNGGNPLETPVTVALAPGETIDTVVVHLEVSGAGTGAVGLVVSSLLDPAVTDTLTFQYQFGGISFEASGPDTVAIVTPGEDAEAEITLTNTGLSNITLAVDVPEGLDNLPDGWSWALKDKSGTELTLPYETTLGSEGGIEQLDAVVTTSGASFGSVGFVVTAPGTLLEPDTVTVGVQAGDISFSFSLPDTAVVHLPENGHALMSITNTGDFRDSLKIEIPQDLLDLPESWSAIICNTSGICYGPTWTIELDPQESENALEVDIVPGPEAGTGTITVVVSSMSNPAVTDTAVVYMVSESDEVTFDRVVLAEMFTSQFCPNCPKADSALAALSSEVTTDSLAVIHWHTTSRGIPDYFLGISYGDARWDLLGPFIGMPTTAWNGGDAVVGGTDETYGHYREQFDNQAAQKSPASLAISAVLAGSVAISVTVEAGSAGINGDSLTVVITEDGIDTPSSPNFEFVDHVARTVVTYGSGIDVAADGSEFFDFGSIDLDESWVEANLSVVALLHDPETLEVIQAAVVPLIR